MLEEVYDAANIEKEMLVIEGSAHAKSLEANPKLYWETIERFVGRYVAE